MTANALGLNSYDTAPPNLPATLAARMLEPPFYVLTNAESFNPIFAVAFVSLNVFDSGFIWADLLTPRRPKGHFPFGFRVSPDS